MGLTNWTVGSIMQLMIKRKLQSKIKTLFKEMPIVAVVGPRQSGKTTLLKGIFTGINYVSLEDPDKRIFAQEDPRRFLNTYMSPAILDEIQRAPELLSYLQTKVDEKDRAGQYLISGSQNFLLMEKVSQSLAGRVGIVTLLPLSLEELKPLIKETVQLESVLFRGFYPKLWSQKISVIDWHNNYIQTYLERDVRQIKNITDLSLFQKFLKLCAGRSGQMLNLSSLANEGGISHNTAEAWLSTLEASYIVYRLQPLYKNLNKRLVKMPKLYFCDVGLLCSLLGIETERQLVNHPLRGAIFETMVMAELVKQRLNQGLRVGAYYLRDKSGHEIDYVREQAGKIKAVEIKAGETITNGFFDNLSYWQTLKIINKKNSYVVYGGKEAIVKNQGTAIGWKLTDQLFKLMAD